MLRYLAKLSAVEHASAVNPDVLTAAALKLVKGGLEEKSTGSDCASGFDLPPTVLMDEGDVTDLE